MRAGFGALSTRHVARSMCTHPVYASKRSWLGKRATVSGPSGQRLVPLLTSLDSSPGLSSDLLKGDFLPVLVPKLIVQLAPDEGLLFDPLHEDRSFQIDPEDVANFRSMILNPEDWLDDLP